MERWELLLTHRSTEIEPDVYDDESGNGYAPLERWGDRRYRLRRHDWNEPLAA